MLSILLRRINKKVKFHQLRNGNVCNSVPLCNVYIISDRAPLGHMAHKKVKDIYKKTEKYQFQVGCIYFPVLKQNKAFKEQVERFCIHNLKLNITKKRENGETWKNLCPCTSHVLLEQEVANLQVIGCFWLFIIRQVCVHWLFVSTERKIPSLSHILFEDTSYDELSGIGIPEMLLNIVSCCVFLKEDTPTVIFTCRSKLVSYYPSKGYVMLTNGSKDLEKITTRIKQLIHAVAMNVKDLSITCNVSIHSVANNLKKSHLSTILLNEFTSTYYDDKNDYFEMFFKQFIDNYVEKLISKT